ncbi:GNAT family N-acetyltransferase [Bauldia sp.]|uniref:GNAT family N-acetyltransferase n=1 Tax=Bauldia sp. TaxID=2575872 RepID=UPI003BA90662
MTDWSIVEAGDGLKPIFVNLIQLYLYDLAAELDFPIGSDGRYPYDYLERFWQHPYLIEEDGVIVGFALVVDDCPLTGRSPCKFLAEFFILKAYRRRGAGRWFFDAIRARHPGPWHVGVIRRNKAAMTFWRKCLDEEPSLVRSNHRFEGEDWLVYAFSA